MTKEFDELVTYATEQANTLVRSVGHQSAATYGVYFSGLGALIDAIAKYHTAYHTAQERYGLLTDEQLEAIGDVEANLRDYEVSLGADETDVEDPDRSE